MVGKYIRKEATGKRHASSPYTDFRPRGEVHRPLRWRPRVAADIGVAAPFNQQNELASPTMYFTSRYVVGSPVRSDGASSGAPYFTYLQFYLLQKVRVRGLMNRYLQTQSRRDDHELFVATNNRQMYEVGRYLHGIPLVSPTSWLPPLAPQLSPGGLGTATCRQPRPAPNCSLCNYASTQSVERRSDPSRRTID